MFAIETLSGIVIKVLEQEDLNSYSFQKELMRPFHSIFASNLAKDVQELVLLFLLSFPLSVLSLLLLCSRIIPLLFYPDNK
jgi:Domain of unknown function (DUF1981)